ncbi:MAG: hypothetical protein MUC99_12030 [Anaerolineae bacterium]|nr:hypothetical protein [Anaerolineae bacterium]
MSAVASSATAPRRTFGRTFRTVLGGFGVFFLVVFALIETVPFVLTVANSFKCLPATREASEAFIPVPPFGIDCRADGVALTAEQTTEGLNPRGLPTSLGIRLRAVVLELDHLRRLDYRPARAVRLAGRICPRPPKVRR